MGSSTTTFLTGGRVFPAVDESVIDDGAVLVEDDRIAWVGAADSVPVELAGVAAGADRVDLDGKFVMRG